MELSVAQAEEQLGDFLSWLFFGVEEPDKVRGCLAPQGANGLHVVHLPNTVFMAGLDGYVTLVKFVAECFSKAGRFPPLRGFAEDYDYAHGFRQFSLSSTDRRFLCAAARAPDSSVRIFVPQKLLFGPRGAPHVFCRVTDMVSAVASVLLLIPNIPHVDDMVGVEEMEAVDSARASFLELHVALNLLLKPSKARPERTSPGGAKQLVALGGQLDFDIPAEEHAAGLVCRIDLPDAKAPKSANLIVQVLEQGKLSSTLAGKMVGQWDHASAVCLGRSGRAFAWPLRELIAADSQGRQPPPWPVLKAALLGFLVFLQGRGPMEVRASQTVARRAALLFVDAALGPDGCRLGGMAWGPGWCFFFHLKVGKHSCRLIPWKAGHIINEAEALAALIWIQTLTDHLQGLDIFLFVDSKAGEGILLKGYSRSAQLTVIASLFWKTVRQGRASVWIGRVPSSLNVADPISRGCFDIARALQADQLTALLPDVSAWETLLEFLEGKRTAKRLLCGCSEVEPL